VRTIFIAAGLLIALQSDAQHFFQKVSGGFNGMLGIPSGEFKDVNDNAAFGIRGHVMYNPSRKIPVHLGLELGYANMGSKNMYFYDSWFDTYQVNAASNIFSVQFKLRLQQAKIVGVRPFAEGLIGWNDFFSTVNVERQTYYGPGYPGGYNDSYGSSSKAEWAMTYGGAAGLDIKLNKEGNLWLEIKTAYMIGRKAKYYVDPYFTSSGQVYFTEKESETNMVIPQVGVKFGL
jgi:hypothetical protein